MSLGVMIAIVGGGMGEGDRQGGIRTGRCHDHAQGHLLFAGGIACLRGDGPRVTSEEERDMEGEEGDLDLGATRCGRVGQGQGPFPTLARDPGRILRIRGTVEAGRDRAAEEGRVSVILGIAGRGRLRNYLAYFLVHKLCFPLSTRSIRSQIHLLKIVYIL